MANTKKLFTALTMRGPHQVLCGELSLAGLPGMVFTPAEGINLPAVAFGHGWLITPDRYAELLRHLASWGIVATAPRTERGPVPSHLSLAGDLVTALDICAGVRLGPGNISVHPDRLAVAGHGMGASAAVLAAARRPGLGAVGALFPQQGSPPVDPYAPNITAPLLTTITPPDAVTSSSLGRTLTRQWGGPTVLRSVSKADADGLVEGRNVLSFLGYGGPQYRTQRVTRALLTGFLLYHLTGDKTYESFGAVGEPAEQAPLPDALAIDPNVEPEEPKSLLRSLMSS